MRAVPNKVPNFAKVWPIGTKIKWVLLKRPDLPEETHIVAGYAHCPTNCGDCDGRQYLIETDEYGRCHYRRPGSSYGLGYWEKIE